MIEIMPPRSTFSVLGALKSLRQMALLEQSWKDAFRCRPNMELVGVDRPETAELTTYRSCQLSRSESRKSKMSRLDPSRTHCSGKQFFLYLYAPNESTSKYRTDAKPDPRTRLPKEKTSGFFKLFSESSLPLIAINGMHR